MNDRQNTVVATVVAGLIVVVVYLCPWRIESTDEIRWSPIYQQPMSYVRMYDGDLGRKGGTQIESAEAKIAVEILAVEVVLLLAVGGGLYWYFADADEADEDNL